MSQFILLLHETPSDFSNVSAEELQQMARLYLVPEDFYELIVI